MALVVLLAALAAGCASAPNQRVVVSKAPAPPVVPTPAATTGGPGLYALAVGDELEIKFPYRSEFNERALVRPDGKISLPLIGPVVAEGKTPEELEQELLGRYRALQEQADALPNRQYLIHPNDELTIRFTHHKDFDDTVRVRPDGRISLPLVKSVIAQGKTPEALEQELIERYRGHLKAPDLVVIVRSFSSQEFLAGDRTARVPIRGLESLTVIVRSMAPRKIYVGGEVARPGLVPYTGPITAVQAVVEAGGPRGSGKMTQVVVLRRADPTTSTAYFLNLKRDLDGKGLNDIALMPSDVVVVPRTAVASVGQFLDQHLYTLLPITRNSTFNFIHNLNPNSAVIAPAIVP